MSFVKSLQIHLDKLSPVGFSLLVVLSGCLAALTRWNPGFVPADFLWAEDAAVFLKGAIENGTNSLWLPYAGYHLVLLRIAALAAAAVDYLWVPTIFFATWLLGFSAMLLTIYHFLRQFEIPRLAILLTANLIVLQPHSGEVFFNMTNVQWHLGISLALLMLTEPNSLTPWLRIPVVVLISLTGPFSVMLSAIVLARAVYERRVTAAELVLMVLAATQLVVILHSGRGREIATDPSALHWLSAFVTFFTFGSQYFLVQIAGLAFWTLLVLQTWKMRSLPQETSRDRILRIRTLQLLAFGALAFGASLWATRNIPQVITPLGGGARYFFVPYAVAILCFAILAHRTQKARILIWLLILVPCVAHLRPVFFGNSQFRAFQAFAAVHTGVTIPVQPPGWKIELARHKFANNYTSIREEIPHYPKGKIETLQNRHKYQISFPVPDKCLTANFLGVEAIFPRQSISSAELISPDWAGFRSNGTFHDGKTPIEKLQFALTPDHSLRQLQLTIIGQKFAPSPRVTLFCIWRKLEDET